jgi:DNA replication protein DnaC
MSKPDLSGIDFDEPFERVIARVRARHGGYTLKEGESPDEQRHAEYDQKLSALVERITSKVGRAADHPAPPPARKVASSAAEVRIGWYIRERHLHDTLHNYEPVTPSQRAALDATRAWVESVKQKQGGALALVGGVGTGKSHLLYAAVRALNEADINCAASRWYDLANLFKKAKFAGSDDYEGAVMLRDRFLNAKAFGIDEIRPTSGTDYDVTELAHLMTGAYERMQGVIVTSNYADENLTKIIGMAATSRLTSVVIEGPDMRQQDNKRRYLGPRAA